MDFGANSALFDLAGVDFAEKRNGREPMFSIKLLGALRYARDNRQIKGEAPPLPLAILERWSITLEMFANVGKIGRGSSEVSVHDAPCHD